MTMILSKMRRSVKQLGNIYLYLFYYKPLDVGSLKWPSHKLTNSNMSC